MVRLRLRIGVRVRVGIEVGVRLGGIDTRQDKTIQDNHKTRQDKTTKGKARQDKTKTKTKTKIRQNIVTFRNVVTSFHHEKAQCQHNLYYLFACDGVG